MQTQSNLFILSKLLSYPKNNFLETMPKESAVLAEEKNHPEDLEKFWSKIGKLSQIELEELYTHTFDIQAVCCLDIGYVLFGEDYKRGDFLVHVSKMMRVHQVDTGSELADHLPTVLRLIESMPLTQEKIDFVNKLVGPAVTKMMSTFSGEENEKNPYYFILKATVGELMRLFCVPNKIHSEEATC